MHACINAQHHVSAHLQHLCPRAPNDLPHQRLLLLDGKVLHKHRPQLILLGANVRLHARTDRRAHSPQLPDPRALDLDVVRLPHARKHRLHLRKVLSLLLVVERVGVRDVVRRLLAFQGWEHDLVLRLGVRLVNPPEKRKPPFEVLHPSVKRPCSRRLHVDVQLQRGGLH